MSCTSLTNLTLPNTLTNIESGAFLSTPVYTNNCITDNGLKYFGYNGNSHYLLVEAESDSQTTYSINADTKIIGGWAFYGCEQMTSITIPSGVTAVGSGAFDGCSALTSIIIPNGVTTIEDDLFNECSALASVTIPSSVDRKSVV